MKKKIFIWLEFFRVDCITLFSNSITLGVSWLTYTISSLHPCVSMKYLRQKIFGIASYTPTSSEYVELVVFSLCFNDAVYATPCQRFVHSPVRLFMSSWTANDALPIKYYSKLVDRHIIGRNFVASKYQMIRTSFLWSSLSGVFTLVQWNAIGFWRPSLPPFKR